jgi:hypothetical protein
MNTFKLIGILVVLSFTGGCASEVCKNLIAGGDSGGDTLVISGDTYVIACAKTLLPDCPHAGCSGGTCTPMTPGDWDGPGKIVDWDGKSQQLCKEP